MKYLATEYLQINLDTEQWECRVCERVHGNAREDFKKFVLIYKRDPAEIHRHKLDPERYEFTFSPDPRVCTIYEYYCPGCGTMMEVEYTVPGAMPLHEMEFDIDSLREKMQGRVPVTDAGEGVDTTIALRAGAHDHASGSCSHGTGGEGQ